MRLERVEIPPHFIYKCKRCEKVWRTYEQPVWCDLKGKPFVDYYCDPCRNIIPFLEGEHDGPERKNILG